MFQTLFSQPYSDMKIICTWNAANTHFEMPSSLQAFDHINCFFVFLQFQHVIFDEIWSTFW